MKTFLLATLTLAVSLSGVFPAGALAASNFDSDEIERTIVAFYGLYNPLIKHGAPASPDAPHVADPLTDVDKLEIAESLAEHLALLPPQQFNDVLGHLAAEYRQSPENRRAIGLLMLKCQDQVGAQILADKSDSAVVTVIHDVFTVWAIYSSIGFAKGWVSKGAGLPTLKPFQRAIQWVIKNKSSAGLITLDGVSVGLLHAITNHLKVKKMSPRDLLAHAQADALYELASMAAGRLAELRSVTSDQIKHDAPALSARVREAEKDFVSMRSQLAHFTTAAPQLKEQQRLIAQDLLALQKQIIALRKDLNESGDDGSAEVSPTAVP